MLRWDGLYGKIKANSLKGSDVLKRFLSMVLLVLTVVFAVTGYSRAAPVNVTVDGKEFSGGKLIGSVTYVPIKAFSQTLTDSVVHWDGESRTVEVRGEDTSLEARMDESYIESKDRVLYSGNPNIIIDGSAYIPIRTLTKGLGGSVEWDSETRTAKVSTDEEFKSAEEHYDWNDLYWLAKIINAESEGESLEGKIAVGNVVLNRVESPEFPDNVYDVIHDKNGGVQFTPVANGSINNYPGEESFKAAKICLENYRLTDKNILFFLNPVISTSTWIPENRDFVMTIGRHDFYA